MRQIMQLICLVNGLLLLGACSGYRTTFVPSLAVTEEYTDNVRLSEENRKSDFITFVSPSFTYNATSPARELSLSYTPSLTHYALTDTDMAVRQEATLAALNRFSRHSRLEFNNTFTQTDDPLVTREIELTRSETPQPPEDITHRESREPYYTNFAALRYRYDLSPDDFLTIEYANHILRNTDPTVEDSTANEPSAALTYWFTPKYGIETRTAYTRGDFSLDTDSFNGYVLDTRAMRRFGRHFDVFVRYIHTRMDFEGDEADYQIYDGTVGVEYSVSQATFFSLSSGFFVRDTEGESPENGYVLRGDMARRFSRGAVRLSGGTGYEQTFFGAENLGFTEYYEGAIAANYQFTRQLTGDAQIRYMHNTYSDVAERQDDLISLEAGLNYLIRPWLASTIRLAHRRLDSNEAGESFNENRVTLSLTFIPTTPWIWK